MMPRFQPGDYDDFGDPQPGDARGESEPESAPRRRPARRSSGKALASLIFGVIFCVLLVPSLFGAALGMIAGNFNTASLIFGVMFCIPLASSLLAATFGMVALRETRDRSVSGRGLAITGTILGLIGTGLWLLIGAIFYIGLNQYFSEKAEVEVVSKAFLQDLGDGKIDAALARTMPGADRKPLEEASVAMKPWGPLNSLVGTYTPILTRRADEMRWKIDADAVFSRGGCEVMLELVKDGSPYRIERFTWKKGR